MRNVGRTLNKPVQGPARVSRNALVSKVKELLDAAQEATTQQDKDDLLNDKFSNEQAFGARRCRFAGGLVSISIAQAPSSAHN